MPAPSEHKTVQARILAYAQEIGWTYVPRAEAEKRRGFDPDGASPEERARKTSLFFGDLLHTQVRAFNPKYKEAEGAYNDRGTLTQNITFLQRRGVMIMRKTTTRSHN
jgi:type I restriction enzyme R subunit